MRRYPRGLLLAFACLVALGGIGASQAQIAARPHAKSDTQAPYLVLIVMDGFRPDYMNLAPMHNLHKLMASGMTYSRAWVGQLESETPTGHATIATGEYPRKHGIIGFGWRDTQTGGFTWTPTDLHQLNPGDLERREEAGGAPTISDLIRTRWPSVTVASMSDEKYYAADPMGTGANYILYGKTIHEGHGKVHIQPTAIGDHVPPAASHYQRAGMNDPQYTTVQDQFVARLALRLFHTIRPHALLLNFPGPDIQGHIDGGVIRVEAMRQVVRGVDYAIGQLMHAYKAAGVFRRTLFVVTADHGMIPSVHLTSKEQMYAAAPSPSDFIEDDVIHTSGYLFLRDPSQTAVWARKISTQHFAHVEGVLYKLPDGSSFAAEPSTASALGPAVTRAYLNLANTLATPSGPDIILPYQEDSMGLGPTSGGYRGDHGGLSWSVQHIPLVISGAGVRHGTSDFPAKLVDIAPTIETLLGLRVPAAVDGVVLADSLRHTPPHLIARQGAARAGRSRDVTALRRHSLAQRGIYLTKREWK